MPPKAPTNESGGSDSPVKVESTTADQASAGASQPASNASSTPGGTPTSSSVSRPGSATAARGGRGRGRATATPKPKFAGRRSEAARKEAEQAEAAKKAAEAQAKVAEAKKAAREARQFGYGRGDGRGRGRGRGARGRGVGRMGDRQHEQVASGPFSSGQVQSDGSARRSGWGSGGSAGGSGFLGGGGGPGSGGSRSGGSGGGGGGGGGAGGGGSSGGRSYGSYTGSGVKAEYGGDTSMRIKSEDGGYLSSDEDEAEAGPKQNIDQMQVVDLTGLDDDAGEDNYMMAPVRLARVPHKDRTVGLSAEDAGLLDSEDSAEKNISEKKKGKQRARDVEVTGESNKPRRPTAYSSSSSDAGGDVPIKEEPLDDDTAVQVDQNMLHEMPSSPETRRKAKEKIASTAEGVEEEDFMPLLEEPKFQTQAEKDEWDRRRMDLSIIRAELGQIVPESAAQASDADGDAAMADETPAMRSAKMQQEQRENHVYMFQFPPVLPDLEPISVKDDPDTIHVHNPRADVMDVDAAPAVEETKPNPTIEGVAPTIPQPHLPSGAVGKLRIHKSGKATLDWGGTSFVLGQGTDNAFLETILLARMPETKPKDEDAAASEDQEPALGMDMGQIRGKFVITPDWEEILK